MALVVTHGMTAELLMRGLPRHLASSGWNVCLIAAPGDELRRAAAREAVDFHGVPMAREIRPLGDAVSLAKLVRYFRARRPRVVSAGTPKAGLLAMLAATLARVPRRVYTLRGLRLETTRGVKRWILAAAERTAARLAHRVVCVSESLRSRALELRLVQPEKTSVLGAGSSNGVDVERFHPVPDDDARKTERRALGLPTDAFLVGFVGRWTRDKGLLDLLAAFDHLIHAGVDAQLVLLGRAESGDPPPATVLRRLRTDGRIAQLGFVADTAPFYRALDVLAFPSYREGFPNAPLEAAACGVPTVAYSATGTVDAVVAGSTGLLVDPGDSRALGEGLQRYAEDAALRLAHGSAARQRAVETYRQEAVWGLWVDFYRDLLAAEETSP